MKKFKLKICGMRDPGNITGVVALQPDYLGFIFYPSSKRYAGDMKPQTLECIPEGVKKTGVFVDESLRDVLDVQQKYHLDALQLHGQESPEYCTALRSHLKDRGDHVIIIKAFGIDAHFDFRSLNPYIALVDFFLFDTQTPDHGGSGKKFDWKLLEHYRLDVPYFLSGGIDLDTAADLLEINDERLAAIDINSKFETSPGMKDISKLKIFKHRLFGDTII